ncbi:hypothetical protein ACP275_08G091400 [Erythranthe tilingii]
MENSRPCQSCRKRTLVTDYETGNKVCSSCGVVQEFDNFQAHIGGITGETGTYIHIGKSGAGSVNSYKENKIYEAEKVIEDLVFKLGLSVAKSKEVKSLIEKITGAEYGQGKWFPVFVGACAYVVMRRDQRILPIVQVAESVSCDAYELGRMISRVVDFVDLKLPEFDIVYAFESAIKRCPSFGKVSDDLIKRMLQQGVFLLQCLIKWFVTTGRQPMPVVAAVLIFVAELNEVHVKIDDVANELHVTVSTCRRRYKELMERLVRAARVLPWGKDVTVKNILKNAPSVIQYMEMKSMEKSQSQSQSVELFQYDMEGLVGDCLRKDGYDSLTREEDCSTSYLNQRIDYPDKFQISHESLSVIYSDFLDEISLVKANAEVSKGNKRRRKNFDIRLLCTDWWKGKSELSKKLVLKQILEKDVGLDATPPSFEKGCLANGKRREKIKSAKLRIQRIMDPTNAENAALSGLENSRKKRKKVQVDIDWEDLIIETLLLHNVKEEEIENGHYNALMALHVFDCMNS